MDLPSTVDAHAASEPPHNCPICARHEEEEIQTRGRFIRKAGATIGVAVHGATFHVADFAFLRAEQGPARIVQLVGTYSGDPIWVNVQLLGRVSDLVDLLPADEPRDEVRLSFLPLPLDPPRRSTGSMLRLAQKSHLRHESVDHPWGGIPLLPVSFLPAFARITERA